MSEPPDVGCYDEGEAATINTTEPGMVLGTPAYMSPEQVRGEPADHRADIFAFGCVLYEMLSGTRAFRRDTPVASMNAVLSEEPPELQAMNPNISPALERVVRRCLEKQPDNRFQSAKDLAFAIENAGTGSLSSSARRVAAPSRFSFPALFPWAITALCLVGLLFSMLPRKHSLHSTAAGSGSQALRKLEIYLPTQPKAGGAGRVNEVHLSPDARSLAYTDGAGLWLKWLDQISPPMLVSTNEKCASPFWSPDSAHIAWFEGEKLLRRPVTGGPAQTVASMDTPVTAQVAGGAWLRGDRIICANADGPLFSVPARGGKFEVVAPLRDKESDFHKPVVVPGRAGVIFVVHHDSI